MLADAVGACLGAGAGLSRKGYGAVLGSQQSWSEDWQLSWRELPGDRLKKRKASEPPSWLVAVPFSYHWCNILRLTESLSSSWSKG